MIGGIDAAAIAACTGCGGCPIGDLRDRLTSRFDDLREMKDGVEAAGAAAAVDAAKPVDAASGAEAEGGAAGGAEPALGANQSIRRLQRGGEDGFSQAPAELAESGDDGELSPEEEKAVDELKARDREVRAHEQAHANVGGQYAGAPSYQYQTGPDGRRYAVGGEVSIDASPVEGDPAATIQKMMIVERAALAPVEPSSQDRKVAAEAQARRLQAQAELATQRAEERRGAEAGAEAEAGYAIAGAAGADAQRLGEIVAA